MVYTKINGECWDCPEGKTCPLGLTCCCNNGVITKSAGSANDYFLREALKKIKKYKVWIFSTLGKGGGVQAKSTLIKVWKKGSFLALFAHFLPFLTTKFTEIFHT